MSRLHLEYDIKRDIRNIPIVREVDKTRRRQLWRSLAIGVGLVVVLLFSAWQHFELLRHGYAIEQMERERNEELETNRHLRLEIETLRSPRRIERIARERLNLVAPSSEEAIVLERRQPPVPAPQVMAALGRATSAARFIEAVEDRHRHVRRLAELHAEHDLLLTPTTATPPPRVGAFDQPAVVQGVQKALLRARGGGLLRFTPLVDQMINENLGWVPYTQLANLTGRPAMSVPLHWTPDGLPVGVMLAARPADDALLLSLAAQVEAAAPWHDRRPPGW